MISHLRDFSYEDNNKVFIWGAGDLGNKLFDFLTLAGIIIDGFFDNSYPEGRMTEKYEIKPLNTLDCLLPENTAFVIGTIHEKEVKKQLLKHGFSHIVVKDMLAMRHFETYEPIEFCYVDDPEVSVCITAYNGWDMTYSCLRSLKENENECKFEIILGDNASTDETANAEMYIKNAHIIHHEKNLQYLGNVNSITKYARGDYVFLLANDILFTKKRYIDTLLNYIKLDDSIGMLTGKLWVPSKNKYDVHFRWIKCGECEEPVIDKPTNVENMWPVATLIPREVWDQAGGYDEEFLPVYYEDTDLEMRIINMGYDLVSYPWAEVIHYCGATYDTESVNVEQFNRNKALFRKRWEHYINHEGSRREQYFMRR